MEASLPQDASEMELMKKYNVMEQVVNAGVLMKMEKRYLEQGLKIKSSVLDKVSQSIQTNLIKKNPSLYS